MLPGGGAVLGRRRLDFVRAAPGLGVTIHGAWRMDLVTLAGADVSQVIDRSGNGNHMVQATAADRPGYIAQDSGYNKRPVLDFDAANTEFMAAAGLNVSTPFTVIVIGERGVDDDAFVANNTNTTDDECCGHFNDDPAIIDNPVVTGGSVIAAAPHLFEYAVGTSAAIRRDSVLLNTGNVGSSTWNGIALGRRPNGTFYANGKIAEAVICSDLSTSARAYLQRYARQHFKVG